MPKRSRYRRKQARIKAERAEAFRASFVPWADMAEEYRRKIREAIAEHPNAVRAFRKQQNRPWQRPSLDDLALTLRAVEALGKSPRGLSLMRLGGAFKVVGLGWSRAKGSASLRSLVDLNLIRQTSGHSAGNRGRKFARVVHQNPNPFPDLVPRLDLPAE